jgi:hypothetical protein
MSVIVVVIGMMIIPIITRDCQWNLCLRPQQKQYGGEWIRNLGDFSLLLWRRSLTPAHLPRISGENNCSFYQAGVILGQHIIRDNDHGMLSTNGTSCRIEYYAMV